MGLSSQLASFRFPVKLQTVETFALASELQTYQQHTPRSVPLQLHNGHPVMLQPGDYFMYCIEV